MDATSVFEALQGVAGFIDTTEVLQSLKGAGGIVESYHVTEFHCLRQPKWGRPERLTVSVFDRGPYHPDVRYKVEAKTEDGRLAAGSAAASLTLALSGVPWESLDRPPIR